MTIQSVHAGHGGKKNGNAWTDPGAVGCGYKEADVARTITDLMVKKTGAKNVTDNTSSTSNGIINNVAANINKCADGWQISNHLNAFNGKATVWKSYMVQQAIKQQLLRYLPQFPKH